MLARCQQGQSRSGNELSVEMKSMLVDLPVPIEFGHFTAGTDKLFYHLSAQSNYC